MTNAQDIIAAKRADIAARERALELDKAELAGMEKMLHLFGPVPRAIVGPVRAAVRPQSYGGGDVKPAGGRQRGAISQRWRRVLEHVILGEAEWVDPVRYVPIIKRLENRETTAAQVRRILDGYAAQGFIEANDEGLYRVTEMARAKFGLGERSAFDALNENGAADAAPDAGGVAAPSSDDQSVWLENLRTS
ncbi:hypothetical protein [Sphingomonas asaccharolytica]|uniref:hypothetical protein n=1 Tax=Sphingomonas asaccharolytica TaxID=40681 RepID=UPI000834E763|nr:hypothetical protein [Sphingomonas asaccharolytica]